MKTLIALSVVFFLSIACKEETKHWTGCYQCQVETVQVVNGEPHLIRINKVYDFCDSSTFDPNKFVTDSTIVDQEHQFNKAAFCHELWAW